MYVKLPEKGWWFNPLYAPLWVVFTPQKYHVFKGWYLEN